MNERTNRVFESHCSKAYQAVIRGPAVFLLRHGATQSHNDTNRFIGQTDLPLTDRGRQQARYWKAWFGHETLAQVCCSDLDRCTETARIIAPQDALPVSVMPELREIHLGHWEGRTVDHVRQRRPDAFARRGQDIAGFRPPGGENFSDLHRRVIPAFEQIANQREGSLLVVAHAGVNRVILCHLLGVPLAHLFRISQCPGAMNIIERRPDGYRVHLMNLCPPV